MAKLVSRLHGVQEAEGSSPSSPTESRIELAKNGGIGYPFPIGPQGPFKEEIIMKNPITLLIDYLRSSRAELEKVSWPTRQDTIRYSLLVVGVSIATAAFFAALDFGLGKGVDLALTLRPASQTAPQPLPQPIQPVTPDVQPTIEAVDKDGNPVNLNVTPIPLEGNNQGGITVTPN